ncbi:Uncharacterized protein TPAR_01049 [Tolypocladium paradoxum]|uniref:Uncharacterized protein n=1 Tax=Tolypocladium paradoxum TaxID=94208 RepID=A0A2S4L8H4_9HYPO|nr:Uncharacterized protein TPAR_01049 [Tolypocladium paradoxum]
MRRWGKPCSVTFEYVADEPGEGGPGETAQQQHDGAREDEEVQVVTRRLVAIQGRMIQRPIEYQLGGGRVDPFRSNPGPWRSYMPALTDHYIVHMAKDIEELDQPGNAGLLRTRWYLLVLSHASTLTVVVLLSAANYKTSLSALGSSSSHDRLLGFASVDAFRHHLRDLKLAAIAAINAALRDPRRRLSDGDVASYRMHMHGLRLMLALRRGGMASLGLGGLLRRIVVWIDSNSSLLLGVERYFPGHTFTGDEEATGPNPARFMAIR